MPRYTHRHLDPHTPPAGCPCEWPRSTCQSWGCPIPSDEGVSRTVHPTTCQDGNPFLEVRNRGEYLRGYRYFEY